MNIILREIEIKDLNSYLYWNNPSHEFHNFNGPYYEKYSQENLEKYVKELETSLLKGESNVLKDKKIISNTSSNDVIGEVNWYWKSKETLWMEVGIVIFNENYWGKGIGQVALKLWIDEIFNQNPQLVRLGLTTWSGNKRMMNLSEKLGFKKEAVYRQARIVDNQYYDSVSYGILKDEWKLLKEDI